MRWRRIFRRRSRFLHRWCLISSLAYPMSAIWPVLRISRNDLPISLTTRHSFVFNLSRGHSQTWDRLFWCTGHVLVYVDNSRTDRRLFNLGFVLRRYAPCAFTYQLEGRCEKHLYAVYQHPNSDGRSLDRDCQSAQSTVSLQGTTDYWLRSVLDHRPCLTAHVGLSSIFHRLKRCQSCGFAECVDTFFKCKQTLELPIVGLY